MAESKMQTALHIRYMDISDTAPVSVNAKTNNAVTAEKHNFICAVAKDTNIVCLPYINNNVQYVLLKESSNITANVSGTKTIRVFYFDT